MADFDDKMKSFLEDKGQDMAKQFQKMQENLANTQVSGTGGIDDEDKIFVRVTLNGLQQVQNIEIGNGAIDNGAKVTADLTKAAFNTALEDLKKVMQKEVMSAYQNAGMPMDAPKGNDE